MKNYYVLWLWLFVLGNYSLTWGQDLSFAQFQVIPSLINPAISGQDDHVHLQFHHRIQAISASERFTTSAIWATYPLVRNHQREPWANINLSFFNQNQAQLLSFNGGVLGFNYNLRFPKYQISFGMQAGLMQRALGMGDFTTRSQYVLGLGFDPGLPNGEDLTNDRKVYPLLSSGLYWEMKNQFDRTEASLGLALMNMNRPDISFPVQNEVGDDFRLSPNVIITGAWEIWNTTNFYIQPNFRWINRQGDHLLHLGSWFGLILPDYVCKGPIKKGSLKLGLWYYSNSAFTSAIQFEQPTYRLSFGYDAPLSNTSNIWLGNGGFEFGLTLKIPNKKRIRRIENLGPEPIEQVPYDFYIHDTSLKDYSHIQTMPEPEKAPVEVIFSSWDFVPFYVKFQENKAIITASKQELKEFVENWLYYPDTRVFIEGYAYNQGRKSSNQQVSEELAAIVKKYLIDQGLDADKVQIQGNGSQNITIIGDAIKGNKNYLVRISPAISQD